MGNTVTTLATAMMAMTAWIHADLLPAPTIGQEAGLNTGRSTEVIAFKPRRDHPASAAYNVTANPTLDETEYQPTPPPDIGKNPMGDMSGRHRSMRLYESGSKEC
ncbi:hypothetical protein ACWEKR_34460 [Nocardia sp. NPDC004573]